MKNIKKFAMGCTLALTLTATSITAFGATYTNPAEAVAGLTGTTIEDVVIQRQSGKTYGMIASEANKLSEFQDAMLEITQDTLNMQIESGIITQEGADNIISTIKTRQTLCNGTGIGINNGYGGLGMGYVNGMGYGRGGGMGYGRGNGMGLRNGSCLYQ